MQAGRAGVVWCGVCPGHVSWPSYECVRGGKVMSQLYVLSELASTQQTGASQPTQVWDHLIDSRCNLYNFLLLLSSPHISQLLGHVRLSGCQGFILTLTAPQYYSITFSQLEDPNIETKHRFYVKLQLLGGG